MCREVRCGKRVSCAPVCVKRPESANPLAGKWIGAAGGWGVRDPAERCGASFRGSEKADAGGREVTLDRTVNALNATDWHTVHCDVNVTSTKKVMLAFLKVFLSEMSFFQMIKGKDVLQLSKKLLQAASFWPQF